MATSFLCVLALFLLCTPIQANAEETSKPRATLKALRTVIPKGSGIIVICSVDHSTTDWKFYWFRDGLPVNNEPRQSFRVTQGGLYHCRGGRGEPVFYTEDSDKVTIAETLSIKPTATLQPSWTLIYRGETITARCEIQGERGTQWTYEWIKDEINVTSTSRIINVTESGDYSCQGRRDMFYVTQLSDAFAVNVSDNAQQPVVSVSPSWLSPGSSVTLRCEVEHPSAGWRFYWYKAVPDRSHRSYSYKLLPGSTTGTEHDSYIINGQTHTAGYVCRAGRGEPVYYTDYSREKFVWSADSHPAASLTVNPDRVQHFRHESVSLTCGGNSTEWRVRRFTGTDHLSDCSSYWGTMTGSSCNITTDRFYSGVYWCESGSGEFSNAVNITVQTVSGPEISTFPVPWIIGSVIGTMLFSFLLLYLYKRPKDLRCIRLTLHQVDPVTEQQSELQFTSWSQPE